MGLLQDILALAQMTQQVDHPGLEDVSEAKFNRALPYKQRAELLQQGLSELADPENPDQLDRRAAVGGGLAGALAGAGAPDALRPLVVLKKPAEARINRKSIEALQEQLNALETAWKGVPQKSRRGVTNPATSVARKITEGTRVPAALAGVQPKAVPQDLLQNYISRLVKGPLGSLGLPEADSVRIAADAVQRAQGDLGFSLPASKVLQEGSAARAAGDTVQRLLGPDITADAAKPVKLLAELAQKAGKTPMRTRLGVLAPGGALLGALVGYSGSQRRQAEAAEELEGMENPVAYLQQLDSDAARGELSAEAPAATALLRRIRRGVGETAKTLKPMTV
jgi:hypothetical protein